MEIRADSGPCRFVTVQPIGSGHDRGTDKFLAQHVEHAVALLAQGVEAGADHAKIVGAYDGADAACYFLFHLEYAHGPFVRRHCPQAGPMLN
jgi:hypothetical protein